MRYRCSGLWAVSHNVESSRATPAFSQGTGAQLCLPTRMVLLLLLPAGKRTLCFILMEVARRGGRQGQCPWVDEPGMAQCPGWFHLLHTGSGREQGMELLKLGRETGGTNLEKQNRKHLWFYSFIFVFICLGGWAFVCTWKSEDSDLWELILSFHHEGSRDWSPVMSLKSVCLTTERLTNPIYSFLLISKK